MDRIKVRLTSRESARILDLPVAKAIILLLAHHVPNDRTGPNGSGPYLWDGDAVTLLRDTLRQDDPAPADQYKKDST